MFDKDTIKVIEKRSVKNLEFIQNFIEQLDDAREQSKVLSDDAKDNIERLKVVIALNKRVSDFTDKLLEKSK